MGSLNGTASFSAALQNLITGNTGTVQEYLNQSYAQVIPIINAAIGDGQKVVRKAQTATTVTTTYDVRAITGDGEASSTLFTKVRGIWLCVDTAYANNVSALIKPKDGSTGLVEPFGSAYSATTGLTAYGPNASMKNLASPVLLVNNGAGWTTSASAKDLDVDPGSTATAWTLIIWGETS